MQVQRTQPGKKVLLTDEKVKAADAEEAARRAEGRLATLVEVVMDRQLVEQIKGTSAFVDWKGSTLKKEGFYRINREKGQLEPISDTEFAKLEWHERLDLSKFVFNAIKEKRPLTVDGFYVNAGSVNGLVVSGDYETKAFVAQVAYVKEDPQVLEEHPINFPMPRTDPKRWEALKRDLGIIPDKDVSLSDDLPHPASEIDFTANGIKYSRLRYEKGKGPNLKQTIEIAGRMGLLMLTREEARAITDNEESNKAFLGVLNEGEWTYVRDSESEARSHAAYLIHYRDGRLYVNDYLSRPDDAASVVILKEAID